MRAEQEKRLKELEDVYMSKKENSQVGRIIRERMGHQSENRTLESEPSPRGEDFERAGNDDSQDAAPNVPTKQKKSVKIADGKENKNDRNDEARPTRSTVKPTSIMASSRSASRGRDPHSRTRQQEESP